MGCLLLPFRLLFGLIWRVFFTLLVALVFVRVDAYVERRFGHTFPGRAYLARRRRGKGASRSAE